MLNLTKLFAKNSFLDTDSKDDFEGLIQADINAEVI